MFNNVGGKIKGLAKVLTLIGIIGSIITGGLMVDAVDDDIAVFVSLGVTIFGCLMSWIGSFLLYGFGQLIENTDILVKQGAKKASFAAPQASASAPVVQPAPAPVVQPAPAPAVQYAPAPFVQPASVAQPAPAKSFCTNCGSEKWSAVCPVCGHGA